MNCLAVDTTNSKLTVVLIKGDETFYREIEVGKSGHSGLLMPTVDQTLAEGGVNVESLDAVCAVVGPGSFTGIRIGVAAMTALAYATGAKRVSVTSFELIAYNRQNAVAAVDAGHGNAYVAECKDGEIISADFVAADDKDGVPDGAKYSADCEAWQALAGAVRKKIARGEFVSVLAPYYMRKSQAERERDEV